jgi:hypothetical protein
MERPQTLAEKAKSPYSYPNWVNPLKQAAYYHVVNHGGMIGTLFPTGLIRVTSNRLAPVNSLSQLTDPARTKDYSHVVISGRPNTVNQLIGAAHHSFAIERYDVYFALLGPKPPTPDWPFGDIYYVFMPGPDFETSERF